MSSVRYPSLDLLRVTAALAVVWLHVAAVIVVAGPAGASSQWWVANLADALSRWCVPVFVMISGAVLLGSPVDEAPQAFYRRRLNRLLVPGVFWTLLYLLLDATDGTPLSVAEAGQQVWRGTPWYHLWYLYMLVGLYLLTPWLRGWLARLSSRASRGVMIAALVLAAVLELGGESGSEDFFLLRCLPFLGYFIAGHVLFRHVRCRYAPAGLIGLALAAGLGIALGAAALAPRLGARACALMYAYQNPLVMLMSGCIFLLFVRQDVFAEHLAERLRGLAPLSFGIYLIHPLWLLALARCGLSAWRWHPLLGIPLTTLAAFVLSALSTAVLRLLPGLRRTVA